MHDQHSEAPAVERLEPPVSVSHFFKVLGAYLPIIGLSLAAVAIAYVIVALGIYIRVPSQRVTTMTFRLQFEGAERGEYPNGTKFSSAEIISMPVLLKAFNENNLARFTTFSKFARSVFVLESNAAQEALSRYFQSRISDPRLTPSDRERIQHEYEVKLASLSKSEYSLNYLHPEGGDPVPAVVIRKVLTDVLRDWAEFVSHEQHVLQYRVPVLSPDLVASSRIEDVNPIVATEVLRAKILRVIENVELLRKLPSAELVRSRQSGLALNDIRIRLEDFVRFRLEPLIQGIAAGQLDERPATIVFLESQLAYDQRVLEMRQRYAEAARTALAMYTGQPTETLTQGAQQERQPQDSQLRTPPRSGNETVMPQVNDTFLDRLVQLTSSSADSEYRQKLASTYQNAAEAVAPVEQAVDYDRSLLELVRRPPGGAVLGREVVEQQIGTTRAEVRQLVSEIQEIYTRLSENLNPSTELMTTTGAPTTRVERALSIGRLGLYGLLTLFIGLPIIIFGCLVHNRIREENAADVAESSSSIQSAA
jgi:hypothetical protein